MLAIGTQEMLDQVYKSNQDQWGTLANPTGQLMSGFESWTVENGEIYSSVKQTIPMQYHKP